MSGKRLIIVAASASEPGQMGGNTKIAIEMARNLPGLGWDVVIVVPEEKKATFTGNLGEVKGVAYCTFALFRGNDLLCPVASAGYYLREFEKAFAKLGVGANDIVYSVCNFHYEIVVLSLLKRKFSYKYLATHYLFSPFIVENVVRRYRFPAVKYFLVWLYERFFFLWAKVFADGFVITNDSDRHHFSKRAQREVLAIYGGVNVDQIPPTAAPKTRDVVFCSRLHPQKGVEGLLDIWRLVVQTMPNAKLSIIGNGSSAYEKKLRDKANAIGIANNIEWLGYVNNEAKYGIYASAKVFVHATVFDNNGMVAAEALCSGLPVAMYDLAPLRDVYTKGCAKVPYGDKPAFARELVRLLKDDGYRAGVAPDAETLSALRAYWNWPSRAKLMADFLEKFCG